MWKFLWGKIVIIYPESHFEEIAIIGETWLVRRRCIKGA